MSSKPTPNLKQNTVLAFDDGLLTIKQSGHGDANGWGELAFHERQVEIDPDGFHKVEIPPSELRELRDFLNRTLPAAETGLTPQQLREALADVARTALDFIEPWMKDRKYPETPEEWCAQHNADVPDAIYAARDRARTAIAKVEGRS